MKRSLALRAAQSAALKIAVGATLIGTLSSGVALGATTTLEQVTEPAAPFNQERFLLGYEVYLSNGNQAAAYRVAERAVRERPSDSEWRRRLATVAQWLGRPEVALANWLAIARQTGSSEAWREVNKLAPALVDTQAMLAWRQYEVKRQPGNEDALQALVAAYEEVGQPEAALAALQGLPRTRKVLEAEANLAQRSGHDEQAIAALLELNRRFGPGEEWIVRAAGLHLQRGQVVRADALLEQASLTMPATAEQFWQMRADVAQMAGNSAGALQAYERLNVPGKAVSQNLLSQAAFVEQQDPFAAAQLYQRAWQQDRQPLAAVSALYQWNRVKAWAPAEAFLAELSAEDLARLEQDPTFLEQRASLYIARGRIAEGGRDLQSALVLDPRNTWLRQAWSAWLIANGESAALRRLLLEQRGLAARQPELWPLWAAGWSRLDAPEQALPWLQQYYRHKPSDLSALALADTLRAVNQPDRARLLEQAVWSRRLGSAPLSAELQQEYNDALFRLRLAQLPVEGRRQTLRNIIKREQGQDGRVRSYVRDLVLGEAWMGEASDTLPAQIGTALPAETPLPRWSQLGSALLINDKVAISTLLENPDSLPANDRVVGAIRLGRTGEASFLAARGAEDRPFDDVADQYLQERISRDGNRVSIALRHEDFSSLKRDVLALDLQHGLTEHVGLHLSHEVADLTSDPLQVRLPEPQQSFSLVGLYWQGEALRAEGALTYLDGTAQHEGLWGEVQWNHHPVQLSLEAGLRQPSTETAGLRVGGYQDYIQIGGGWQLTPRTRLQAQFHHALLVAQGSGDLGEADTVMLGAYYQLNSAWSLSARVAKLTSIFEAVLPAQLIAVAPLAALPSPGLFVPEDYTLAGLGVSWGESAEYGYQRRWRPFASAEVTHDDIIGVGYQARVGVLGPVRGRDRLRFYADGSEGAQANAQTNFILNLDYQFFY
ncbi:MAG: tetratricopeptide repeat protein [Moraxellaceae bacterium]|nr:tetratricopeptide repeat protein [Moraxellaceae bacterium]